MKSNRTSPRQREPDRERFDAIFRDRFDEIRGHARRVDVDPDDLASETFAALWRQLASVRPGSERAWLYAAARRIAANQRRTAHRRDALEQEFADSVATSAEVPGLDDPSLTRALEALGQADRELLLLAVWGELSNAELSLVAGVSRGAVAVRLHRARTRFRSAYRALEGCVLPTTVRAEGGIDVY